MRVAHGWTMCLRVTCIVLPLVTALVSGVFDLKDLHLRWGRHHSDCVKLNLLHDITIVGCYKQCTARAPCKSFNYRTLAKTCELCANDDATGGVVQRPQMGYVLSQEHDWTPMSLQVPLCCCPDGNQVCDVEAANKSDCRIKECGPPISPDAHAYLLGNTRDVGSRLIYTCSTVLGGRNVSTVCAEDGTWTPVNLSCTDYLGCFEDKSTRSLPDILTRDYTSMTTELCRETCRAIYTAGTNFYFGTQAGYACSCGTNYPIYPQVPESKCSTECVGNSSQTCGGQWLMNVYKTYQ